MRSTTVSARGAFAQFTDADFHKLDVEQPVSVSCTLGALSDRLKNIEAYGLYLRAFDPTPNYC